MNLHKGRACLQGQLTVLFLLLFLSLKTSTIKAFYSNNNLGLPHDKLLFLDPNLKASSEWENTPGGYLIAGGMEVESGVSIFGTNGNRERVNPGKIWSSSESYFHSMDATTNPNVNVTELQQLFYPPLGLTDVNGKTLRYDIRMQKRLTAVNLWLGCETPIIKFGNIGFYAFLPLKDASYSHFVAELTPMDQHLQQSFEVMPGRTIDLNDLSKTVNKNLGNMRFDRSPSNGVIGDLLVAAYFSRNFALPNAAANSFSNLTMLAGLTFPTAPAQDPDEPFTYARGNDNAVGILVSLALNAVLAERMRLCASGDVLFSLPETSLRRLRKTPNQTELLLSDKALVRREPGNIYRVTTLCELSTQSKIYSGLFGWQFLYQHHDKFKDLAAQGYDELLVNKQTERWQNKYFQQLLIGGSIDFKALTNAKLAPKIKLCYKIPFLGKRTELFVIGQLSINFNF